MTQTLTTLSGREVVLLRDAETFSLPRDPKISAGLAMFRQRRQTGVVEVVDCDTSTRWFFELCAGQITGTAAVVGVDVPAELRALPHPLALFRRDAVIALDG